MFKLLLDYVAKAPAKTKPPAKAKEAPREAIKPVFEDLDGDLSINDAEDTVVGFVVKMFRVIEDGQGYRHQELVWESDDQDFVQVVEAKRGEK